MNTDQIPNGVPTVFDCACHCGSAFRVEAIMRRGFSQGLEHTACPHCGRHLLGLPGMVQRLLPLSEAA